MDAPPTSCNCPIHEASLNCPNLWAVLQDAWLVIFKVWAVLMELWALRFTWRCLQFSLCMYAFGFAFRALSHAYGTWVDVRAERAGRRIINGRHDDEKEAALHLSIPTTTMTAPAEPTRLCVTTPDGRLDLLKLLAAVLQELHSSYLWKILKILVYIQLLRLALWSFDRLYGEVADTIAAVRTLRKKREEVREQRAQYEKRPPV